MKISYQPANVTYEENMVHYEFNTTDKDGNKVMDELTYEETWKLINEIAEEHGQFVFIKLSGDAVKAFNAGELQKHRKEWNEETQKRMEEKAAQFQQCLEPAGQKMRRFVPNIKTQSKLDGSLKGEEAWLQDAVDSIIDKNFLPYDVGELTEKGRRELIYAGLEQAKFVAQRLKNGKADVFMEAMETIAKYGLNGRMDGEGKVRYDIRQGSMDGLPDDYMSTLELMKKIAPKDYELYCALRDEVYRKTGRTMSVATFRFEQDWRANVEKNYPGEVGRLMQEERDWRQKIDCTKLDSPFIGTDMSNIQSFTDSILKQSIGLNYDYLFENLKKFSALVTGRED